jgi:iron(III) transport system permease protein
MWGVRDPIAQWGLAALTAFLVLVPIVPVFVQAVADRPIFEPDWQFTFANFGKFTAYPGFGAILANTLIFAVSSVVIAQIIGAVAAILIGRTNMPSRGALGAVMLWPLLVSHLILGFGWFLLYGPAGYATQLVGGSWSLYSMAGMALAAGVAQAPITYVYCVFGSSSTIDPTLEDAARTSGARPWQVIAAVTLPLMKPALIYSAMLNMIAAVEMLSIPLMFGDAARIYTFSTFLYDEGIQAQRPDLGLLGAASILLIAIVMGLIWLQVRLLGNLSQYETVRGKASRPKRMSLGRGGWVAAGLCWLFAVIFIIAPIFAIVARSFTVFLSPLVPFWTVMTLQNFAAIVSQPQYLRAIFNTFLVSFLAAGIGTVFFTLVAAVINRSRFPAPRALEALTTLPRAVPGIIAGLGVLFAAALLPPIGVMRGTFWILVFAYLMTSVPIGISVIVPALMQIGRDIDNSARVSGADWVSTTLHIVAPMMKSAMFGCFVLLFIIHLKTYVTAVFLTSPGSEVMGTIMLFRWDAGETGLVAAFATVQIAATILFIGAARLFLKVNVYE